MASAVSHILNITTQYMSRILAGASVASALFSVGAIDANTQCELDANGLCITPADEAVLLREAKIPKGIV